MDDKFAKGLARTTAHWLAYKRLSGFDNLFSEALLIIPITEYLLGQGYRAAAEQDSSNLFGIGARGEVNYDLQAQKDNQKLLVEMKYLKTANDQRIIRDFVKLALPPASSNYERMLLIGYDSGQSNSTLMSKISPDAQCSFKVNSNADVQMTRNGTAEHQPFAGVNQSAVKKWMEYQGSSAMLAFRVQCSSTQTEDSERVIVFSVHRE